MSKKFISKSDRKIPYRDFISLYGIHPHCYKKRIQELFILSIICYI